MTKDIDSRALTDPIFKSFLFFVIPSVLGLIAMSSASIVDGIFVGNYVGVNALAAINFIMPFFSLMFGIALMLAIGGSVRAGKYIGEGSHLKASAIFSKTIIAVTVMGLLVFAGGYLFKTQLYFILGVADDVIPYLDTYFTIILPFLIAQLIALVIYFFVRLDNYPNLGAASLTAGAVINIILDYIFILQFNWGIAGAAWATGISQLFSLLTILLYFILPKRNLRLSWQQSKWSELFHSAMNGISEFFNEISAGVIMFLLNWMLVISAGVEGVAAITVINYLLMIGFMLFFAIGDSVQVFVSQNFGAKQSTRLSQFLWVTTGTNILIAVICISALLGFTDSLIQLFLDESSTSTFDLAKHYIGILWPIFIVNGFNVTLTAYLTAIHLPLQSVSIALSRSLILPTLLLLGFFWYVPGISFLIALPLAEGLTFILACVLFWRHRPTRLFSV